MVPRQRGHLPDFLSFWVNVVGTEEQKKQAWDYFNQAYQCQIKGQLEEAIRLYTQSLETFPTAEAYTFRGWTYSFMGKLDEAIAECLKAIEVDPHFGNPYNDIGAYLIEKGQWDEAIAWLEKAIKAPRYDTYFFPHVNLGRIWERKGEWYRAIDEYKRALELNPRYEAAARCLARLRGMLN